VCRIFFIPLVVKCLTSVNALIVILMFHSTLSTGNPHKPNCNMIIKSFLKTLFLDCCGASPLRFSCVKKEEAPLESQRLPITQAFQTDSKVEAYIIVQEI